MDNVLEEIDRAIVLTVNAWHSPVLDEIMWLLSSKLTWIPFYFLLIYLAFRKLQPKQVVLMVSLAVLSVIISDLICTYCFKEVFMRYRPSHNLLLEHKLHFYENKPGEFYKGGSYGFISSHAANFFAIAIFVGFSLKKYYPKLIFILLSVSMLVCFSRVYLGVHYLSDILGGAFVGTVIAFLAHRFLFLRFSGESE